MDQRFLSTLTFQVGCFQVVVAGPAAPQDVSLLVTNLDDVALVERALD